MTLNSVKTDKLPDNIAAGTMTVESPVSRASDFLYSMDLDKYGINDKNSCFQD